MVKREIKFRIWAGDALIYLIKQDLHTYIKRENILMQYTGLKDKNGKEIWEGDLIPSRDKKGETICLFEVIFYQGGFRLIDTNKKREIIPITHINQLSFDLEVIGNIYENKELL